MRYSLRAFWLPKAQRPRYCLEKKFRKVVGMRPNLDSPKTLSEKIQWLKLNYHNPLMTTLGDKYTVRPYVAERIGEEHLIPLIGVYDSVSEIDFDALPEKFILKASHGSGWNIICKDKRAFDVEKAKQKLALWLDTNFYDCTFEWQYKDMKPRILCETLLERPDGKAMHDHKILFLNGIPQHIQVIVGREKGRKPANAFFSTDWELLPIRYPYQPQVARPASIPKPKQLETLLDLAQKLVPNVPVVRVDLYIHEEKIYFGELTFTPRNGYFVWEPAEYDRTLGDRLELPEEYAEAG